MLTAFADHHRDAPFPKKAYRAELQKTVENAGLGLQVSEFLSEAEITHALYYRYRNAHHCAEWFGPFSMLHRRVGQVAKWVTELHGATKKRVPRLITAIKISIQKIQTKYLQPAFWSFYSVLALGQYITVGFALLGTVSRIASLLAQVHPIPRTVGKYLDTAVKKGADIMADDIGEVLVRVNADKPMKTEKTEKKKVKGTSVKPDSGKPKKSLEKMDIDDIFSTKKKKKKSIEKVEEVGIVSDDDMNDDMDIPEPSAPAPKIKKAKIEVDNFFEDSKPKKKKKPASLDNSLEPPKKKKKKLDSGDGTKKKKKKRDAIDDIFG